MTDRNCRRFEDHLGDLLEGLLSETEGWELESHAAGCDACRELRDAVRDSVEALPHGPELTAGVLQRTSGAGCGRAREQLGDLVAGTLAASDAELVRGHADHCKSCGPLAEALGWMMPALAAMAKIDPGPGFTEAVSRRTSRRMRPVRTVHEWFAALLQRPRLAWEGAYVGAFLLVLLFGTPFSPLREVPPRALALARVNPVRVVQASVLPPVTAFGQKAWTATGGAILENTRPSREKIGRRIGSAWTVTTSMKTHLKGVWGSVLAGDMGTAHQNLMKIGSDLVEMWLRLTSKPPEQTENHNNNNAREV